MYLEPSAPPLIDLLKDEDVSFGCEYGCDVEFLVGVTKDDLRRIPAHSCKLMGYPVFKAMLSEKFCRGKDAHSRDQKLRQIRIEHIGGKAFDNLLKFIYKKPVNLQATEMTIETLKAAHEFILPELVQICVQHLSKMISLEHVLLIFANSRYLCNDVENLEQKLTSTGGLALVKRQDHLSAGLEMKRMCLWLLCECLAFIDVHTTHVLKSDDLENLDRDCLQLMLRRNSLDVSEADVFSALVCWAETECKRQQLPLTSEFKREVLLNHNLLYLTRYFCMTTSEFESGPATSGLLNPEEVELIRNMIAYGRPFLTRRLSCYSKEDQFIHNDSAIAHLKVYWGILSQPRTPRADALTGAKKGYGNTRRKSSIKAKKFGLIVKRICLPCAYGSKHVSCKSVNNSISSQSNSRGDGKKKGGKRESTMSKILDYTLQAFAFFFD